MKLSEYRLLKEYINNDEILRDWYYLNTGIDKKYFLKTLYNSLEFKSYLCNYYLNEMKKSFIESIKKLLRIKNGKM